MKRKIALLLLSLVLILGLSAPAFAAADPVPETTMEDRKLHGQLSDDLQTIQVGNLTYVRADVSRLTGYFGGGFDIVLDLTDEQKETIKSAYVDTHKIGVALEVTFTYHDNSRLTAYYIDQSRQDAYTQLLTTDDIIVELRYPDYNRVKMSAEAARGQEEILFIDQIYRANTFEVLAADSDGLEVYRGELLMIGKQYYYFDFDENGTTDIYENERCHAWLITDEELVSRLDAALEEYYEDGLGVLEDQDFSEKISRLFLIFLFVALPGIAFVVFLILAIRAKTPVYRKLLWNLCAWSALVLILVGTVVLVVQLH